MNVYALLGLMIPLVAVLLLFGIPIIAIWTDHRRKVLDMKLRSRQQADQALLQRIDEVQRQLIELRETATQYDVSFDTSLQRIEARLNGIERRVEVVEQSGQRTTH
ncbi:MAG TPA: hypothetical protein VLH79_16180 [Chthonomonadales bacterium]|nr:hypothetical protein [Chthonomonadales bacterium]